MKNCFFFNLFFQIHFKIDPVKCLLQALVFNPSTTSFHVDSPREQDVLFCFPPPPPASRVFIDAFSLKN